MILRCLRWSKNNYREWVGRLGTRVVAVARCHPKNPTWVVCIRQANGWGPSRVVGFRKREVAAIALADREWIKQAVRAAKEGTA